MTTHVSEIDLQRLADEGVAAVATEVVAHVRDCPACADIVRYARAASVALRKSMPVDAPSEEIFQRVIRVVCAQQSAPGAGSPRQAESRPVDEDQ